MLTDLFFNEAWLRNWSDAVVCKMRAVRDFSADTSAACGFFKLWIYSYKLSYFNYSSTNSLIASINRIHLLHLHNKGLVIGRFALV